MTAEESAERIFGLLTEALSEDAMRRQHAEAALREAEEGRDYFAAMAMITTASDENAEPKVRWLAAVCAKNAVLRSWRRVARKNLVTEDERSYVRDLLLSGLGERHSTIATQVSVWIGRVARIDFPRHWPSLITDLTEVIRCKEKEVLLHAVVTLDMVLKELASKRLQQDRKALYNVAPFLFSVLHELFVEHLNTLLHNQAAPDVLHTSFLLVQRCMKSVRRLIIYGCLQLNHLTAWRGVFSKLLELPDVFMRGSKGGNEMQERLSLLAVKLVRSTLQAHPVEFQEFLSAYLDVYFKTIIAFDPERSSERTCMQAAAFLRNVLECVVYDICVATTTQFKEERAAGLPPPEGVSPQTCRYIVLSFFDESRVNALVEATISKIFVLNESELETWANDPEALVREEEAAEWGVETLRNECEEILKRLLIRDKNRIVALLGRLTESVSSSQPLLLDACYRAVGRAGYDIEGAFNFDNWLDGQLGAVLQADYSPVLGDRVIQARTAWLVGQFAAQLSRESRQKVNALLVRLLSTSEKDLVVSLTAAKAIQTLVEDLNFHSGDFAPHLEACFVSYFRLTCMAEAFETKRLMVQCIQSLVERCHSRLIIPLVDLFAAALPEVWEQGRQKRSSAGDGSFGHGAVRPEGVNHGEENMLRTSIVCLLTAIVKKAGPASLQSPQMRKVTLLITDFSIDSSPGKGGAFMMDDGCDLWLSVVRSSAEYSEDLSLLFGRVPAILGGDFDHLKEVVELMKSYCLLGEDVFMKQYGAGMLTNLESALRAVNDRGCLAVCEVVEVVLQLFHGRGVRIAAKVLQICLRRVLTRCEGQAVMSAYIVLLARAFLCNAPDFEGLVLTGDQESAAKMVEVSISNLDSLSKRRQNVVVLAVVGMTTGYCSREEIQQQVPMVLNAVVQVLSALETHRRKLEGRTSTGDDFYGMLARIGEDGGGFDLTNALSRSGDPKDPVLPGDEREKAMRNTNMAQQTDIVEACKQLLLTLKHGSQQQYDAVIGMTDKVVLQLLERLLQT